MISTNDIEHKKVPKQIDIISKVLRVSSEDSGRKKYQLLAINNSKSPIKNIRGELRYYNQFKSFIGADYGFCYQNEVLPKEKFTINFELDSPEEYSRADLIVSLESNNWYEKHKIEIVLVGMISFIIFSVLQKIFLK